ncbi:MAG: hypothetical protein K2W96_18505, partial [Gemmataceae bacterium]|nr:hypothetical protein [Gemmataceae bacterium]
MPDPPSDLLALALERVIGLGGLVWNLCITGALPEARVEALLRHEDQEVAFQAAVGEWHADPSGSVRLGLRAAWREAALRSTGPLPDPFYRADGSFARDWLAARYAEGPATFLHERHDMEAAYAALDASQRADLLALLPDRHWAGDAVQRLVGDDLALYRALLSDERLRVHHRRPLRGRPDAAWAGKAVLALEAGYSAAEVAEAGPSLGSGWPACRRTRWTEWLAHYEALDGHADRRLREVARAGREAGRERLARMARDDRREDSYEDE